MVFRVSFEANEVYQMNLVKAESSKEAERIKKESRPSCEIIMAKPASMDDYRPDVPLLEKTGNGIRHVSCWTYESFHEMLRKEGNL